MEIEIKKDITENGYITGYVTGGARIWKDQDSINYITTDFFEIVEKLTKNDIEFLEKGNIIFWDDLTIIRKI